MNAIDDLIIERFFQTSVKRVERWIDSYTTTYGHLPPFRDFLNEFMVSDDWDVSLRVFLELTDECLGGNFFVLKEKFEEQFDAIIKAKEANADGHEHHGTAGIPGSHTARTA